MNIHPDLFGDDLSSVISTEALLAHDLVPEGLPTSCKGPCGVVDAKMLITPERNLLSDDLIEALECLQAWWNNDLIKRP
jgi:hypothetical protein